jgi:hypothetical protein
VSPAEAGFAQRRHKATRLYFASGHYRDAALAGAAGPSVKGQRHSRCYGIRLDLMTFEKVLVDSVISKQDWPECIVFGAGESLVRTL